MEEQTDTATAFLSGVNGSFILQAKSFISEIYELENKDTPNFDEMTSDDITAMYGLLVNRLNNKLMHSRNVPIPEEFIDGLIVCRSLPKSTIIILSSILKNK